MRPISEIAPEWWDYTTRDREILYDAARLSAEDMPGLNCHKLFEEIQHLIRLLRRIRLGKHAQHGLRT